MMIVKSAAELRDDARRRGAMPPEYSVAAWEAHRRGFTALLATARLASNSDDAWARGALSRLSKAAPPLKPGALPGAQLLADPNVPRNELLGYGLTLNRANQSGDYNRQRQVMSTIADRLAEIERDNNFPPGSLHSEFMAFLKPTPDSAEARHSAPPGLGPSGGKAAWPSDARSFQKFHSVDDGNDASGRYNDLQKLFGDDVPTGLRRVVIALKNALAEAGSAGDRAAIRRSGEYLRASARADELPPATAAALHRLLK